MKLLIVLFTLLTSSMSYADVLKDFDGLGENKDLFEKAKALHPDIRVTVVQDRIIDRRNRLEFGLGTSLLSGGDPYINSFGYGLNLQFHLNPWISFGVRGTYYTNALSKEGENLIYDVDANGQGIIPENDYLKNSLMGVVNIYPFYGKMSMMNLGITHFDVYFTGAYGELQLNRGTSPLWNAGLGLGVWWSQYITTRLEFKHQAYTAQWYNQDRDLTNVVTSLDIGVML